MMEYRTNHVNKMPREGYKTLTCEEQVYDWIESYKHAHWKELKRKYNQASHNAVLKDLINLAKSRGISLPKTTS